jgi:hypothetical protein
MIFEKTADQVKYLRQFLVRHSFDYRGHHPVFGKLLKIVLNCFFIRFPIGPVSHKTLVVLDKIMGMFSHDASFRSNIIIDAVYRFKSLEILAENILLRKKNKGELPMHSFFLILALLFLVTLVYVFAYRTGYRDAQSLEFSLAKNMTEPVSCLLDKLSDTTEATADKDGSTEE